MIAELGTEDDGSDEDEESIGGDPSHSPSFNQDHQKDSTIKQEEKSEKDKKEKETKDTKKEEMNDSGKKAKEVQEKQQASDEQSAKSDECRPLTREELNEIAAECDEPEYNTSEYNEYLRHYRAGQDGKWYVSPSVSEDAQRESAAAEAKESMEVESREPRYDSRGFDRCRGGYNFGKANGFNKQQQEAKGGKKVEEKVETIKEDVKEKKEVKKEEKKPVGKKAEEAQMTAKKESQKKQEEAKEKKTEVKSKKPVDEQKKAVPKKSREKAKTDKNKNGRKKGKKGGKRNRKARSSSSSGSSSSVSSLPSSSSSDPSTEYSSVTTYSESESREIKKRTPNRYSQEYTSASTIASESMSWSQRSGTGLAFVASAAAVSHGHLNSFTDDDDNDDKLLDEEYNQQVQARRIEPNLQPTMAESKRVHVKSYETGTYTDGNGAGTAVSFGCGLLALSILSAILF